MADTVSIQLEDGTKYEVPANPAGTSATNSFDWDKLTANSVSLIGAGANLVNSLAKLQEDQPQQTQAQTQPQREERGAPWLLIGVGLVVVAGLVYFIAKK